LELVDIFQTPTEIMSEEGSLC